MQCCTEDTIHIVTYAGRKTGLWQVLCVHAGHAPPIESKSGAEQPFKVPWYKHRAPVKASLSALLCCHTGGMNFDAKLRRESTSVADLFYGHISGMDAMARGLRNAARLLEVCRPFTPPDSRAACAAAGLRCSVGGHPYHPLCALLFSMALSCFSCCVTACCRRGMADHLCGMHVQDGILPGMVEERYSSYSRGVGQKIRDGKVCRSWVCRR